MEWIPTAVSSAKGRCLTRAMDDQTGGRQRETKPREKKNMKNQGNALTFGDKEWSSCNDALGSAERVLGILQTPVVRERGRSPGGDMKRRLKSDTL